MTFRSKGGLRVFIDQMFPTNINKLISAETLRGFLHDLVDSLKEGTEPYPQIWGRIFVDVGQVMTDDELEAAMTVEWVRQGVRVEDTVYIDLPEPEDIGFAAFYVPTTWWVNFMEGIGFPRLRGGFPHPGFVVLHTGLVGALEYTLVRSLARHSPAGLGRMWQVRDV